MRRVVQTILGLVVGNASIANRLLDVLGQIQRGEVPVSAFAAAVECHASALEGLPREMLDRLSRLSVEAIRDDVSPLEAELMGLSSSDRALREAELLLQVLRDA